MTRHLFIYIVCLCALLLSACSTTSHLPEGEVLYTGVSKIQHHAVDTLDEKVLEVVATALEVAPNSAFLGSAYRQSFLPFGLWIYNGLYPKQEKGLRYWFWSHFKSDPTLISQVNPAMRAKATEAVLRDEGYFDATVDFDTVYEKGDSLRARLSYDITYQHHSYLGSITYVCGRNKRIESIVHNTLSQSLLHTGSRFSSADLEAEQERIAATLQDSGYFFFQPEHVRFAGDSTMAANTVHLRVLVGLGVDSKAMSPCTIDSVHYKLDFGVGLQSRHADSLGFVSVGYNGPQQIHTSTLQRSLGFGPHALYSPDRISLARTLLARLNTFKYTTSEFRVLRQASDSLQLSDTTGLLLNINSTFAHPWQGTTEVGCVYKDNRQMGPGVEFNAMRRNLWGGGEKLSFTLDGSYEWYTGQRSNLSSEGMVNSYELGARVALSVPRLQLPHAFQPNSEKPVSSNYSIGIDWIRRAGLFEMIKASGAISYDFSFDRRNTLSFTPLKLTYVSIVRRTDHFEQLVNRYPSLAHSFENQFIPQLQVSWTYDNATAAATSPTSQYLNLTVAEAGGLTDVLMGQFGSHREQGHRQLFYQPFSQFLKTTAEFRNLWRISSRLTLASRLIGGIGYAYGNSSDMPYSETFYIGGPNSLRGFPVRGIGPGSSLYYSDFPDAYDYLDRYGDVKLEGNLELRFPIVGSLQGALFADAGNVWRLRKSRFYYDLSDVEDLDQRDQLAEIYDEVIRIYTEGETMERNLLRQLAVDVGVGFRLDLGMLVLRMDVGVPLHDPNSHGPAYFNCRHGFFKNLGYNLAVGYPF